MIQLPTSIEGFNEADVREDIIMPLLTHLGYRTHTRFNIIRELSLRYPRAFLGRKDRARDPELRGRADYVLEVDAIVRWTIEAKPSSTPISLDDIEQAYTYANHPEVRAVLFSVISGAELRVYQTNLGPAAAPIVDLKFDEVGPCMSQIESVLTPEAILRNYPIVSVDQGVPIGPGLRSVVRIVSGSFDFERSEPAIPLLLGVTWFVEDGGIERDESGRLVAFVRARAPFKSANEISRRLGLDQLELVSVDSVLSTRKEAPTTFRLEIDVTLPAGTTLPDLLSGGERILEENLTISSTTIAEGALAGTRFEGRIIQRWTYHNVPTVGSQLVVDSSGQFELVLG